MRRRTRRSFNLLPIILFILFAAIISGLIYYFFINSSTINSGILLEKRENANSYDLKLGYDDKTKWVKVSKKLGLPDGIAYNVRLSGIVVKSITPCEVRLGKVLSRSSKFIELDNGILRLAKTANYYRINNNNLARVPANSVVVGSTKSKFILGKNGDVTAIIVGPMDIQLIRVGISNSNFSSLDHRDILFHSTRGMIVKYDVFNTAIVKDDYIDMKYSNGSIEISTYTKTNNNLVLKSHIASTKKRVYLYSASTSPIYVDSLKRPGYEYIPKYYGNFEIFALNKALRLINEVDVENYLRFVVPSEMLPSGGVEGYKVQAVAARTYLLSDMLSGRFASSGFHVDDTTKSQVYNSLPANDFCDKAIQETSGEVMTYDNKIIDAKYYSTSCGVGAPFNEVYYNKPNGYLEKNPEPYLAFKNYSSVSIDSLSNEENASAFLKDWTIRAYDSNSPYFRWDYTLDWKTLSDQINAGINKEYKKNPESFLKKWFFTIYRKAKIPEAGLGNITDLYISKRGTAGNVLEMTIVSDSGTYRIEKDWIIKRLLISKNIEITPLYGPTIKNSITLPSSFFVIDKEISNGKVRNVTIYGGGFGHGVGMSQYGAIGLVRMGKNYRDILQTFYADIKIVPYQQALKLTE